MLHNEVHRIATLTAGKAFAQPFGRRYVERWRLVIMERTQAYIIHTSLAQRNEVKVQDNFSKEFVENGVTCIVPNVRQDDNGNYQLFNIVHLPLVKLLHDYKDVQIVHELLHTVESSMKQLSKDEIYFKFGFDEAVEPICHNEEELIVDDRQSNPNEPKRSYEIFSENLHQQLAIEVTRRLHEKGIYLYGDQKIAKETGSTSYEHYNVITANFQKVYREEIIDGMMSPTRDGITEIVGTENFERLNLAVNEYAELPYYNDDAK